MDILDTAKGNIYQCEAGILGSLPHERADGFDVPALHDIPNQRLGFVVFPFKNGKRGVSQAQVSFNVRPELFFRHNAQHKLRKNIEHILLIHGFTKKVKEWTR